MRRTPRDSAESVRKISRRGLILGGAQLGFAGILGLRMRFMQVDQADEFRLLAEENRINIRLIPPSRGQIFDRNGVVIAENAPSYRITMVREDAGNVEDVIARLSTLVELDEDELNRALAEMERSAPFLPITVADRVSWEDISRVAVNTPALPGVTPEVGLSRFYPHHDTFAHVVGYVGPVSERDLARYEDPEPVLRIPRFQIGKVGVEAKYEEQLRGDAGAKRVEVNAVGRVMRELDREEGKSGADMQLTLDSRLQSYTEARLEGESASVVVIDLETGDLRAVASAPTFDPNLFVRGISGPDWRGLNENKYRPLSAKTVQGAYPPGSTFKMVVAMAALESGLVGPEDTEYCPGFTEVGGSRFHCWKRGGHGNVNMHRSLQESCDVYYYEISQKIGIDRIAEMARRLGVGVPLDVPMSAVSEGVAPDTKWKRDRYGEAWRIGDTVNASIGQGYVLATPLQLAVMSARLATGRDVRPRLVHSIGGVLRCGRAHGPQRELPAPGTRGDERRVERRARHRLRRADRGRGHADGRQVRHQSGAPHHRRRARARRHLERRPPMGTARPCALGQLRPL